jgi:hypothetical protein
MGRASLKTILYAVFCAGGVVYLGGCTSPIDLAAFVKDPGVVEIIEQGAGTVNLSDDSSDGLKAGNKKITGLDPDTYYMVEEWHKDKTTFLGVQFVSASGERSDKLVNIGMVKGREITGLTNNYNYRVKSAGPLLHNNALYNVPYNVLTSPSGGTATNIDGVITFPEPEGSSSVVYTLKPPTYPPYDSPYKNIVQLPITPPDPASSAMLSQDGNIITIMSREKVIDYVFFGDNEDETFNYYFYFLRVVTGEDPGNPGGIVVTVDYTSDNSPLVPLTLSYQQNATTPISITIANNSPEFSNITWYLDGDPISGETGASFEIPLNTEAIQYRMIGVYTITVIATKDNKPYAATIKVTVLE